VAGTVTAARKVPLAGVRAARDAHQIPAGILRAPEPMTEAEFDELLAQWETARGPVRVLQVMPPGQVTPLTTEQVAEAKARFFASPPVEFTPPSTSRARRRWFRQAERSIR
jgi:hypothetical protein